MLSDITAAGVRAAIAEFDAIGREQFLDRYGFGRSRSYVLVDNGREYDSKAICGAAHGFDFPESGPLSPADFSGGRDTVQRRLEQLGFTVRRGHIGKQWTEEERVLALDLYLRHGLLGKTDTRVVALSRELNERAFHPDAGTREDFRNPAGVALKLANFAALDPSYPGAGMSRHSAGDRDTWEQYAGDEDALTEAASAIREGQDSRRVPSPAAQIVRKPLEQRHVDAFTISTQPRASELAVRREADLVEKFATWLEQQGRSICRHDYPLAASSLRCDLFDETTETLWEAKGEVGRFAIRLAIGQLLDYRRFESEDVQLGVLLPRAPSLDLQDLIASLPGATAWPDGRGGFITRRAARE